MLITDQVATAPCTDPTQVRFLTFEGKAVRRLLAKESERIYGAYSRVAARLHRKPKIEAADNTDLIQE